MDRVYICIDLKSFYASVECVHRGLDPLKAQLLVADESRSDQTICLAVSPPLKAIGVPSRPRLFEAKQAITQYERAHKTKVDYIIAVPRMAEYERVSALIYSVYLRYVACEDIHVYSIDECFIDCTAGIYIHGGEVTAKGGKGAAGIGAGNKGGWFNVNIWNADVNAKGGIGGAGIGGGCEATATGVININGGSVNAESSEPAFGNFMGGAGIGAGSASRVFSKGGNFAGTINIEGGNVTAVSGGYDSKVEGGYDGTRAGGQEYAGAAIGAGDSGNMTGTVNISGGRVHAIGRHGGAAIGAGKEADFEHIGGECKGTVNITGGTVKCELRDCTRDKAKDTAPIGHGGNAGKNGTLNIRTGASVKRDGKAVPADQNIEACRRELGDYIFGYTTVEIFN